jgi:hypothetical protein
MEAYIYLKRESYWVFRSERYFLFEFCILGAQEYIQVWDDNYKGAQIKISRLYKSTYAIYSCINSYGKWVTFMFFMDNLI